MAVVEVHERFSSRRSRAAVGERISTRVWIVRTDNIADGPEAARQANGIPRVGNPLVSDPTLSVRSVDAQPIDDDPLVFTVTVEYARSSGSGQEDENPLDRPVELSWDFEIEQVVVQKDKDNVPIQSSAGEPPDPPLMEDEYFPVLSISMNQETYSENTAIQYAGAVNSDDFMSAEPGQAKIVAITGTRLYESGIWYYKVTTRIKFNRRGWVREMLDQGLLVLNADNKPVRAKDANGKDVTSPILLDGEGKALAAGGTPVYLKFHTKPELPFAAVIQF